MSERLSLGPVQVFGTDVFAINDALRQLSDRIDELKGLRGRGRIYDRIGVDDPIVTGDAVNLGTRDASDVVTQSLGKMSYLTDAVKYTDDNGTVLHGMGNV